MTIFKYIIFAASSFEYLHLSFQELLELQKELVILLLMHWACKTLSETPKYRSRPAIRPSP